jgi:hypothetical protein
VFIFNLQRRKISTVLNNIILCTVINAWAFKCKKPLLGMVAQSNAMIQLPHFPRAVGPTLHPSAPHTCDTVSKLAEDDVGTSEIFMVSYS